MYPPRFDFLISELEQSLLPPPVIDTLGLKAKQSDDELALLAQKSSEQTNADYRAATLEIAALQQQLNELQIMRDQERDSADSQLNRLQAAFVQLEGQRNQLENDVAFSEQRVEKLEEQLRGVEEESCKLKARIVQVEEVEKDERVR